MILQDLNEKYIVLTGASGQLGSAISKDLNNSGAKVIGIDLNLPNNDNFYDFFQIDISNEIEIKSFFNSNTIKSNQIYGLVNNAGYSIFNDLETRTKNEFMQTLETNLWGPFLMTREFANLVNTSDVENQYCRSIVNISSIYGVVSPDFKIYDIGDRKNSEVYGASKAGLIQISRYFSVLLADKNIRVNSVSSGGIFNDRSPQSEPFVSKYSARVPMNRMAKDFEISKPVLFLLSQVSSYITGANLIVDGGLSAM